MTKNNHQIRYWAGGTGMTKTSILSVLRMEGFDPHVWFGQDGDVYPLNTVPYQRIIWVAEGALTVQLPEQGQEFELQPGDRLDLPAGIPHVSMVSAEPLICVEARRYVSDRSSTADLSTKELLG